TELEEKVAPVKVSLAKSRRLKKPPAFLKKARTFGGALPPPGRAFATPQNEAPPIFRKCGREMRRWGNEFLHRPAQLLKLDKERTALFSAFLKGQICQKIHPEDVLRAIDQVVSWSVRRGTGESGDSDNQGASRQAEGIVEGNNFAILDFDQNETTLL